MTVCDNIVIVCGLLMLSIYKLKHTKQAFTTNTTKCQPFCILHQLSHYTYHKMSTLLHFAPECRQTLVIYDASAISKQIRAQNEAFTTNNTKCQLFCILYQLRYCPVIALCDISAILKQIKTQINLSLHMPQIVNPFVFFASCFISLK